MGDVLVKWRMAKVPTVVELVGELPKEVMPESEFRSIMKSSIYGDGFQRTAYQLACQLGLYCIDNNTYIPRFQRNITEREAKLYMENWIWHYYVPNPYTKSFSTYSTPQKVMKAIIEFLESNPTQINLQTICTSIWGESIGNLSNLSFVLNEYGKALHVDSNYNVTLDKKYKQYMEEA